MFTIDKIKLKKPNKILLPYNKNLTNYAKKNRNAGILSEVLFWQMVKSRKYYGLKFSKQKVIGNYIVDFYCDDLQFVVEIDGDSHNTKLKYDVHRDKYFAQFDIKTFRIQDIELKQNADGVYNGLKKFIIDNYAILN